MIKLNPGQHGTYAGFPAVVVRHYAGNMYEIRTPGGVSCADGRYFIAQEERARKFKVELTTHYMQGPVDHWTHVLAKDADDARRQLEREGHEVRHVEVVA